MQGTGPQTPPSPHVCLEGSGATAAWLGTQPGAPSRHFPRRECQYDLSPLECTSVMSRAFLAGEQWLRECLRPKGSHI